MATAAVRRFWTRVAALGCAVHGPDCAAEIAHGIGKPSVNERTGEPKPKGKKLPRHDWLVLGLCPFLHRIAPDSLDLAPRAFEARYGSVAGHLDRIAATLGVDVWTLANEGRK